MVRLLYSDNCVYSADIIYNRIKSDLSNGKSVLLIVPDQEAVIAEETMAELCDDTVSYNLEICSFSRLSNSVFRCYGGLSYNYVNRSIGLLIVFLAICSVSKSLKEYKNISSNDSTLISSLYEAISELKNCGISVSDIVNAEENINEPNLKNKLNDIALIFSAYEKILSTGYDDPLDDMQKMNEILSTHNYFENKIVYISSFYSFSAVQYKTIEKIMCKSAGTNISIPYLPDKQNLYLFKSVYETERRIKRLASDNGIETQCELLQYDNPNKELKFISDNLWTPKKTYIPFDKPPKCVVLNQAENLFDEAQICAVDIVKRVREGAQYRDIFIAVRQNDTYRGILDAVFDKYGIPYFISDRTDIKQKAFVKFILSILDIYSTGFRCDEVVSFIKTGLLPVRPEDMYVFEEYIIRWSLHGRGIYDLENDWNMNPDGYGVQMSEAQMKKIETANNVRRIVVAPLNELFEIFRKSAVTVDEISKALYLYCIKMNVRDMLEQKEKEALSLGYKAQAQELSQVWNVFWKTVDDFALVCKGMTVKIKEYSELLSMALAQTDIGRIPTSIDEVTVGGAENFRAKNIKIMYILGVNDGEFPKVANNNGIFADKEKDELKRNGIELSDRSLYNCNEMLNFYRCAALPSDMLILSYYKSTVMGEPKSPSTAIEEIRYMFPRLEERRCNDMLYNIEGEEASFEYMPMLEKTSVGAALRRYYSENEKYRDKLASVDMPISSVKSCISKKVIDEVIGDKIYLSQSKIQAYSLCPFNYFCDYVLHLNENSKNKFKNNDIGSFIHYVLQKYLKEYKADNDIQFEDDISLKERIGEYSDDYFKFELHLDVNYQLTKKLLQMAKRLQKYALVAVKSLLCDIKNSDFVPSDFEIRMADSDEAQIKAYRLRVNGKNGNAQAIISGIIDRVDIWESGNEKFVKIIDYKSSETKFNIDSVENGLGMQLPLYLFAICENGKEYYGKKLNYAAAFYKKIIFSNISSGGYYSSSTSQKILDDLSQNGIVLDSRTEDCPDSDLLFALDKSGKLKNARITSKLYIAGSEEFEKLKATVDNAICDIVDSQRSGVVEANPKIYNEKKACEYCKYRAICRIENSRRKEECDELDN